MVSERTKPRYSEQMESGVLYSRVREENIKTTDRVTQKTGLSPFRTSYLVSYGPPSILFSEQSGDL